MRKLIGLLIRFIPRKFLLLIPTKFIGTIAGFLYRGNKVLCPICLHRYKKFMPYGRLKASRNNVLCPNCLSLERHRLIWIYLNTETNFFSDCLSVLHIAPEVCFINAFEKQHQSGYITGDLESPNVKINFDVHNIPFPDDHFDVIICNHVLEHVDNDIQVMTEFCRVMKPGGWGILQVPFPTPIPETTFEDSSITSSREREKVFGQRDHVRNYGKDYVDRLKQGGFDVEINQLSSQLPKEKAILHSLDVSEEIFVVRKPTRQ